MPEEQLVDAVARAISQAHLEIEGTAPVNPVAWEKLTETAQEWQRVRARAAIAVVREYFSTCA